MNEPVYQTDPGAQPDDEFEPGTLEHLVPGNRGRLLDARRTPIAVTRLLLETGTFEIEIAAFEDEGAHWEIEAEHIAAFQFAPGQPTASGDVVAGLRAASAAFDRTLAIPCSDADRTATTKRIEEERERARRFLPSETPSAAIEAFLDERGLTEMDEAFAAQFVSNPSSGELVKGHAIVLARLGLCAYEGKVVRSPSLFADPWSEDRRGEHLVARLAFVRELHASEPGGRVTLYRGVASDRPLRPPSPQSFVSATFDPTVAMAHFDGGSTTVAAALYRQSIPIERLLMTHRETRAMTRRFRESEAVLIGDPASPLF